MKLIFCLFCGDVIKLRSNKPSACECGRCGGVVLGDTKENEVAYYHDKDGETAIPLLVDDRSLHTAIKTYAAYRSKELDMTPFVAGVALGEGKKLVKVNIKERNETAEEAYARLWNEKAEAQVG